MSKKLIFIIVALFSVQISVYTITHNWEEKQIPKKPSTILGDEQYLLEKYPDYEIREIVYLNGQNLTEVPAEILLFKNLKYLHLENNQLTDFPYEVLELEHLEHLFLNNNSIEIVNIEQFINASESLHILELAENQLGEINGLYNFPNLTQLDLSNNGLTELTIQTLNLERINLSSNDFRFIPNLSETQCRFVGLTNNRIETLDFNQLPYLVEILEVQNNEISSVIINEEELNFFRLNELDLSSNALTLFPNEVLKIKTLSILKLNQNLISLWSSEDMPINENIKKINLADNNLIILLVDLNTLLPNLQSLVLANNRLVSIALNHDNLYVLHLQGNDKAICDLKLFNLNRFHCDYSQIETEEDLIVVPNLEDLRVYNSEGFTVSQEVANLRFLTADITYE